jgi:hypothetical protein
MMAQQQMEPGAGGDGGGSSTSSIVVQPPCGDGAALLTKFIISGGGGATATTTTTEELLQQEGVPPSRSEEHHDENDKKEEAALLAQKYLGAQLGPTSSAQALLRARQVQAAAGSASQQQSQQSGTAKSKLVVDVGRNVDGASLPQPEPEHDGDSLARLSTPNRLLSSWKSDSHDGHILSKQELSKVQLPSSVSSAGLVRAFMDKVDDASRNLVTLREACDTARLTAIGARAASSNASNDEAAAAAEAAAEKLYTEARESMADELLRKALLVQQLTLVTTPMHEQGVLITLSVEGPGYWERFEPPTQDAFRRLAFAFLFVPRLCQEAAVALDDNDVSAAVGRSIGWFDRRKQSKWSAVELASKRVEQGQPLHAGTQLWVEGYGEGVYVSPAGQFEQRRPESLHQFSNIHIIQFGSSPAEPTTLVLAHPQNESAGDDGRPRARSGDTASATTSRASIGLLMNMFKRDSLSEAVFIEDMSWAVLSAPEQIVCIDGHPFPQVNGIYTQRGTTEVRLNHARRPRELPAAASWAPTTTVATFKNEAGVRLAPRSSSLRGRSAGTDQILWVLERRETFRAPDRHYHTTVKLASGRSSDLVDAAGILPTRGWKIEADPRGKDVQH